MFGVLAKPEEIKPREYRTLVGSYLNGDITGMQQDAREHPEKYTELERQVLEAGVKHPLWNQLGDQIFLAWTEPTPKPSAPLIQKLTTPADTKDPDSPNDGAVDVDDVSFARIEKVLNSSTPKFEDQEIIDIL